MTDAGAEAGRAPPAAGPDVAALEADLRSALGPGKMSTRLAARQAASRDFAHLSPILSRRLPERVADLVVYPESPAEITAATQLCLRHRSPITPRGRGTGNYGQATPLDGGTVIDTSRCEHIEIGDGWARAEAGASFTAIEAAARRHGQEIAIMPTTTGSAIGGFLAGGAGGVGSIEHGWIWDGFVRQLEVVPCVDDCQPQQVTGADCLPYLHAYGVTGLITVATVRLAPARQWQGLFASYADEAAAIEAGRQIMALEPAPRLLSVDEPALVATYPPDPAMPPGRHSLRAVVDRSAVEAARTVVVDHGGRLEAILPDGAALLATYAFNHVTLRARRARPDLCHLQLGGGALTERLDEARATLPGAMVHLDGLRVRPPGPASASGARGYGGLLLSTFHSAQRLYEGVRQLRDLGIDVIDPHTWLLGGPSLETIREAARRNDPYRLLNPGKLPPSG